MTAQLEQDQKFLQCWMTAFWTVQSRFMSSLKMNISGFHRSSFTCTSQVLLDESRMCSELPVKMLNLRPTLRIGLFSAVYIVDIGVWYQNSWCVARIACPGMLAGLISGCCYFSLLGHWASVSSWTGVLIVGKPG